jgi:hypothetical protein
MCRCGRQGLSKGGRVYRIKARKLKKKKRMVMDETISTIQRSLPTAHPTQSQPKLSLGTRTESEISPQTRKRVAVWARLSGSKQGRDSRLRLMPRAVTHVEHQADSCFRRNQVEGVSTTWICFGRSTLGENATCMTLDTQRTMPS